MLKSDISPKLNFLSRIIFGAVVLIFLSLFVYIELKQVMTFGERGRHTGEAVLICAFAYKLIQAVQGFFIPRKTYLVSKDFRTSANASQFDGNLIKALETLNFKFIGNLSLEQDGEIASVFFADSQDTSLIILDSKGKIYSASIFEDGYLLLFIQELKTSSLEMLVETLRQKINQQQAYFNPISKVHGAVKSVQKIDAWLDWEKQHGHQQSQRIFLDSLKLWLGLLLVPLTLYFNRFIVPSPVDINNPIDLLGLNNPTSFLFFIGIALVVWAVKERRLNFYLFS